VSAFTKWYPPQSPFFWKFNDLPFGTSEQNYIAKYRAYTSTSTYYVLSLCKVWLKSTKQFRRSSADKIWWTDRQTESYIPPNFVCRGIIMRGYIVHFVLKGDWNPKVLKKWGSLNRESLMRIKEDYMSYS
jgi:hypothetical protein